MRERLAEVGEQISA
jgi:hypothetical protein